jgi:hypothetical protein
MLSKNKVIERVVLEFERCGLHEPRSFFSALSKHGDGIHLKQLIISAFGYNPGLHLSAFDSHATLDSSGALKFLTRWPKAVAKLEIRSYTPCIDQPETFIKALVAAQLDSLVLTGAWYNLEMVAAAVEQPCFQLKELSLCCSVDRRTLCQCHCSEQKPSFPRDAALRR